MRKLLISGLLLLTGCRNVNGPFSGREPERVVGLWGCRLPPEREPLKPLPEEGQVYSYQEILGRARIQATVALESFYVDNWNDLEEAAQGLEQTARFLPKASEPPARHKDKLA